MSDTVNLDLLLAEIDLLKAELQLQCLEIPRALQQSLDIAYTHDSIALEGGALNLAETDMVIRNGLMLPGKSMTDNLTALNHYQAIQSIREQAAEQNLLSAEALQNLHGMLCRGLQHQSGGAYRSQAANLLNDQAAPQTDRIPRLLAEHLHWLNLEGPFLHPLLFAAEAHLRILSLQPFQTNNGLCARLLMNLILLAEGFPLLNIAAQQTTRSLYVAAFTDSQAGAPLKWPLFIAEQALLNYQYLLRQLQ